MADTTAIKDTTKKIKRVSDKPLDNLTDIQKERRGLSICIISRGNCPTIWMQHMCERVTKLIPSGTYWNYVFAIGSPETTNEHYAALRNRCVKEAMRRGYREMNPLLGSHPSQERVDIHMGVSLLFNIFLPYLIPEKYRQYFYVSVIRTEIDIVDDNYSQGLR